MPYSPNRPLTLLSVTLAGALANQLGTPVVWRGGLLALGVLATFVRAAGGTSVTAHIQTSFDSGASWMDIMAFAFLTTTAKKFSSVRALTAVAPAIVPTDGTLTDDTVLDGVLGDQLRCRWTSTGTYTGASSLVITAVGKG